MKGNDIILDILLQQDRARYNLDKSYIYMRCPFCDDGGYKRTAPSFNIKVPDEENPRWLYNCFRAMCGAKGYITPDFLRMIDHNNYEANVYLNKINKLSKKEKRFREKAKRYIENFPSPDDKLSRAKLAYVNNRLGLDLSFKDLIKLKIHTSFEDLYKYNEIEFPKKKFKYYKKLSLYGVAFISTYNDYLIVRNATKDESIRRYSIVDIDEFSAGIDKFKFYTIPTKIDILNPEPVVINIAEGTFDILSVYYNLDIDREYKNQIYSALAGAGYLNTLIHFIRQYGLIDCIINIFSDTDMTIDRYEKINKKIKKYTNSLEMKVFYNKLEKDFGFPKSKIELQENIIY